MDPMTNPAVLTFSALLPVLIMILKQAKFPDYANALIAFAVYIVVGVVGAVASSGAPSLETIVPFVATVTLVGTAAYNLFWSQVQTGGTSLDARITAATSFLR